MKKIFMLASVIFLLTGCVDPTCYQPESKLVVKENIDTLAKGNAKHSNSNRERKRSEALQKTRQTRSFRQPLPVRPPLPPNFL